MDNLQRPLICSKFMCISVHKCKQDPDLCKENEHIVDNGRNTDRMFMCVRDGVVMMIHVSVTVNDTTTVVILLQNTRNNKLSFSYFLYILIVLSLCYSMIHCVIFITDPLIHKILILTKITNIRS